MKLWNTINPTAVFGGNSGSPDNAENMEKDRLGNCMRQDEIEIQQKMVEIGSFFYRENKDNTEISEEYLPLFEAVSRLERSKLEYYQQILRLEGNMLCLNCQAVIPLGSIFCNHCGQRIPVEEPEASVSEFGSEGAVEMQKRYCSNCNAELEADGKFCMRCGTKVEI